MNFQMHLKEKLCEICSRYGVADMYAFGSREKEVAAVLAGTRAGMLPAASDLDIGVLPEKRDALNTETKGLLAIELEDLFQVGRVDLVQLNETDPYLALDIIRGELMYTNDPDQQARYELFVLRRAGDLLPFKIERTKMILEEGAR